MPKLEPPKNLIRRILATTLPADAMSALCSLSLVIVGAVQRYMDTGKPVNATALFFMLVILVGVLQFASSCYRIYFQFVKDSGEDARHSLEGCLHTLHAMLMATVPENGRPGLRITIHLPDGNGPELVQLLEYVGERRTTNKTAGRRFKAQCGIIGQAFRQRQRLVAKRVQEDHELFIKELTTNWSYTEQDARTLSPASRSWMAAPLCQNEHSPVRAIVFADSIDSEFFENQERLDLIESACSGIARFIDSTY